MTPSLSRVVLALVALALAAPVPVDAAPPIVASVSVEGNRHVPTDDILAVITTKPGDPFDPAKIQNDLRAIADLGFFADQAPPTIKQRRDGVAVTFRVVENPVLTAIHFEGNKGVSADTLQALMDSAPGQVFNVKTWQQDVLKINSYYDKAGFGGQLPSHVINVDVTPQGVLTVALQEGLTVRHVIVTSPPGADPVLPPNVITAALVTKPGNPYSDQQRDRDYEALKELYKKSGMQIADLEAGVDPTTVDQKAGTADVRYTIYVARVGAVEITGNTTTHDDVIRRELRLRPGMVITEAAVRRDYDRLHNLGFFDKVDFDTKPGADPKRPGYVTLNWQVKEQRTGTVSVGAGYSGGATGTGLTGNISYSQNNINGTGNGASIKYERGSQLTDAQLSFTIPYLGKTERSQKYSLTTSIYDQRQLNYYPVYYDCSTTTTQVSGLANCPVSGNLPVSLIPANTSNYETVSGITSNYLSRTSGISTTLGRRLSDVYTVKAGVNLQSILSSATLPSGYYFPNSTAALSVVPTSTLSSSTSVSTATGIVAPSIATINSSTPYALHSLVFGLAGDTRNDVFNPRTGFDASLSDEISNKAIGSDFNYQLITFDTAKFIPVGKDSTFALHLKAGTTTGAIPSSKLFTFSDQELRGYSDVFYGTDILLAQAEYRFPLTADKKFSLVGFMDSGGSRIRGGESVTSDGTTTTFVSNLNSFTFHSDVGVGLRFDIPQLGLHTLRLDFAKGSNGMHTSFGIGQSF